MVDIVKMTNQFFLSISVKYFQLLTAHSFLYTGETPSNDVPVDNYPVMITQRNGKKVPVVQAYAYTKYLGKLHLIFDSDGNLEEIDGRPMLLDKEVPRDEDVVKLLDIYRPGIDELEKKIVGSTRVALDGVCRTKECNLGENYFKCKLQQKK